MAETGLGCRTPGTITVGTREGGGGGGDSNIIFFTGTTILTGQTRYFTTYRNVNDITSRSSLPLSGVIDHLYINSAAAPGVGETYIITLIINGAPTALTATIAGAAANAFDLVNAVVIVAGDTISMRAASSVAATDNARMGAGMRFRQ